MSTLTNRHMQFAWTTLGTLMITDAYVLLLSWGAARGYSLDLFYISF